MTQPVDPIAFDFALGFKSSADRIGGDVERRKGYGQKALLYHVPFLDDLLRGIAPHDLVLLGAPTGAGKTELVRLICQANARQMKRVHLFALEAEEGEIEMRTKYSLLAEYAFRARGDIGSLDYRDWYFGRCEDIVGDHNEKADRAIRTEFKHLYTYYRGSKFDMHEMVRLFKAVQTETDLIVLDHLHYVDLDGDNENTEYGKMLKLVRATALEMGKPVILVAHLRKRDLRSRSVVPEIEMFHGSSEITKVSTVAIMLGPARIVTERVQGHAPYYYAYTFFHVPKDRAGGNSGYVAACPFDRRFRSYAPFYTLGRLNAAGDEWTEIEIQDRPRWAVNHRGLFA